MGNKSFRFLISVFIWSLRAFDAPLVDRYIVVTNTEDSFWASESVDYGASWENCEAPSQKSLDAFTCVSSQHMSRVRLLLSPASPKFPPAVPPQRLAQVADRRLYGSFLWVGDWDSRLLLKPSLAQISGVRKSGGVTLQAGNLYRLGLHQCRGAPNAPTPT